jgi:hypothetical protein
VKDYHEIALDENRTAFAKYLEAMPGAEYLQPSETCPADESCPTPLDPLDTIGCGRAREYFGFDEYFVNDKNICEDIVQFQNSRDFKFLDNFFNQGSSEGESNDPGDVPLVPQLVLTKPDAGKLSVYECGNCKKMTGDHDWLIYVSLYFP